MRYFASIARNAVITTLASGMMAAAVTAAPPTLRFATEEPFGTPPRVACQYGLEWFAKAVPKATGDAVQVKLYSNATLGSEKELIKSVASGVIDATVLSPGNAAGLIPELQLFSAGYLFTSFEHARKVLERDDFFDRMQQIVRDKKLGFQLAGISLTGSRNLYNRIKVINSLDGLSGLKMRVMSSPTEMKVWSALGTLPTTIPGPEIYSALQSGVVDAAESSIPAIVGGKYYEVAPNITLTNHQFNLHLYLIGDRALAKVPAAARPALLKAFRDASRIQIDAAIKLTEEKLQFLRTQPNVTVTAIDTAPFAKRLASIQDEVAANLKVQDLLQMIRSGNPEGK